MIFVTSFSPNRIPRQQHCIGTWQKYGHKIIALQPPCQVAQMQAAFPGVEVVPCDDVGHAMGKPLQVRVRAHIAQARLRQAPALIVNSDISIKMTQADFAKEWRRPQDHILRLGIRTERVDSGAKWLYPFGIDVFQVTPKQSQAMADAADPGFVIGGPLWDYWLPWELANRGCHIRTYKGSGLLHQYHAPGWTANDLDWGHMWFKQTYNINGSLLRQYIRAVTGRLHMRQPGHMCPTDTQLAHRDRKLCICTTPRTGSNLLMYALEEHPAAISAGELCCPHNIERTRILLERARLPADECNLFKLFVMYKDKPLPKEVMSKSKCLYLYRRDEGAQVASWQKACTTGQWTDFKSSSKHYNGQPVPFQRISREAVVQARADAAAAFGGCGLSIAYEDMVGDWDGTIAKVLDYVGWPQQQLEPQTLRQG